MKHKLTQHQIEILKKALIDGVSGRELARRFGITPPAVSWHRAQLIKEGKITKERSDERPTVEE